MTTKFNPFGTEQVEKTALEVMQASFGIGFRDYDRGASVWDVNRTNKAGKVEPGWVHRADLSLECVIEFSVNEGKGTGRQAIPANEFPDYLDSLQTIIDTDYAAKAGPDRTQYVPTYQHVEESFKMVRPKQQVTQSDGSVKSVTIQEADPTVVSVRCTGGKGAKPMLVPQDQFAGVVAALVNIGDNLEAHTARARDNYEAEQAAKPSPLLG
jgi:hypothetical protein